MAGKYNLAGHVTWAGRVYGNGHQYKAWSQGRIYHGVWGSAPFQSIYQSPARALESWFVHAGMVLRRRRASFRLLRSASFGFLILCSPVPSISTLRTDFQAMISSSRVGFSAARRSPLDWVKLRSVTALLHLLQPPGAPKRTAAFRTHFLEIQGIRLCDALAAEICRLDRGLARSQ